jgi:type IV secretory pathway TraG/TraD family ATPase VirD4
MTGRIATAEWADQTLVEKKYVCKAGDVWLGRSGSDRPVAIGYTDDRHVCVVSGSRGGKGATSIVNNLILWPGSLCVVDPKGENATITAARRGAGSQHCKGLGQSVQVLDPFKAAQIDDSLRSRFNPLDVLDPAKDETIDEAGRIADAVVVVHESNDPFWDESARSMVKGLILHVLTAPEYEGRRNLVTVRKLILRGDRESVEALRAAGETDIPPAHGLLWTGLANNPAFGGLVAGIGDSFTNMLVNSPKQFESVLQVANRNTEFIDSPAMQHCLEASDFRLAELKTRPGGLSVYLCLPQRFMSTHYRWLRMMIALTVTEMEKVRGRPATGYPVLMLLDEFAGLKRMEVIENAVAQIAGYGVKLFFVLQSLEQLKAVYKDNWETFLANAGLKVFFNLEDHFSREYVSKLIGETEQIREVRTASDSVSESESVSRSKTRSQSETSGRSSSTGTSESDGTNSSVNKGRSWGVNSSEGRNFNWSTGRNWAYGGFLGGKDWKGGNEGKSDGRSYSEGKSKGWTEGSSEGVSHGTSESRTDGTSESSTTGTSETEGTTRGTSQSRTAGTSETIQKRALITPDEIGQVFARIDDRAHAAYPGLALIVISGTRPMAVRRVNYYEDFRFMGLFDPSPDYPYAAPKELTVEGRTLGFSLAAFGLHLGKWSITPGQIAAAGDEGALVVTAKREAAAPILVPRDGMITAVAAGEGGDVPDGPLFSLLYYDDGAATGDPFADLRRFCEQVKFSIAKQDREKQEKGNQRRRRLAGAVALAIVLAVIVVVAGIAYVAKRAASERAAERARTEEAARAAKAEADAKMEAIYGSRTGKNAAAQPSGQSTTPDPIPAPASDPFMVGKIDVSHFAGLTPGDTPAKVAEIYGLREWAIAKDRTELFKNMLVIFKNGALRGVQIRGENAKEEAEAHVGMDPLLALFGRSETDVVALLGPPKIRETPQDGTTALHWGFSMPAEMKDKNPDLVSQILMLKFSEDSGCNEEFIYW